MAIQTSGQVQKGSLASYSGGASPINAQGQFGDGLVSELNARYANLVLAGVVYAVQYTSGTVAAASATAVGPFGFYNPANSGKNLVLLAISAPITTFTAGTTGAGLGLQFVANQTPTTVTAGNTPQNCFVGSAGSGSVAKTYTVGTTVGAPTVMHYGLGGAYLDLAAGDAVFVKDFVDGLVIIGQNSGCSIVMTGTLVATLVPTIVYAEIPA